MTNSRSLLWLDSDDHTISAGRRALQEQGWVVDQASSLVEALDRISSNSYSAVILDLQLPDILGTDAWTYIRKLKPDILGIMTTHSLSLFHYVRVDGDGLLAFLHKPLSMSVVMDILTNNASRYRLVESDNAEK